MDALAELPPQHLELLKPPWFEIGRAFTLGVVAGGSKLFLSVLNTLKVQNHQTWLDAIYKRPPGVALVTYSNHTSMFDDPGILSAITPWSYFWTEPMHKGNRWTLCAREVCFKNELLRQFFANGKTLPIVRGEGVDQPVMKLTSALLAKGDWVHVFPEGRIHFSGQLGPFKWGPGKLICDARQANGGKDPLVLPFFHSGMGRILPLKAWMFRAGHQLDVVIGEPVDLSDITCDCNKPGKDQQEVWTRIVARMKQEVEKLADKVPPNINQVPDKDPVTEGYPDANKAPS